MGGVLASPAGDQPGKWSTTWATVTRTAISNHRLLSMDEDSINFRYKDYRDQDKQKVMSLSKRFIRRFYCMSCPKVDAYPSFYLSGQLLSKAPLARHPGR